MLQLQDLVNRVSVKWSEGYDVSILRTSPEIVLAYEVPDLPVVADTARYLSINYRTVGSLPGVAKFDTLKEACDFVERFGPVDYEKILDFAEMIHRQGWQDAIYAYTDEWTDDLPVEVDGKPYWIELPDLKGAELVTTAGSSNVYGSLRDVARPENEAAILVKTIFDSGESHVEMAYLLEALEIEEDSLEELLAEQLVANDGVYAFVPRDLTAAVWLLPVPENLEFLEAAVETEDFKRYYDEGVRILDRFNNTGLVNERKEAVEIWLEAVEKEVSEWRGYDEENRQELGILIAELKENYV